MLDGLTTIGPKFGEFVGPILAGLAQAPCTLLHGDYRADNMMFGPDDSLILMDFQITGTGSAAFDLAYFVTQSLDADIATANARPLFERWCQGLTAAGVPVGDLDRMWDDYRAAALFCLVYPVGATRGMDLTDPRQIGLIETMMARMARACDELSLADLV